VEVMMNFAHATIGRVVQWFGVAAVATLFAATACAQTVEDFYKSKQISMLVGSGAGGGYDVYARAFARYVVNYIPGHPAIIIRNEPAAGGLAAASTLYNNVEKDGLTIAALTNGVAMDPLFGNPGARFDSLKFNWLGSIGKLQNVCATWFTSPVKTIADARAREVVVGGVGATSNTVIVPKMLNEVLGTRFKVIPGYDPSSGLNLGVESGEVEGVCGLSWSTLKASRPDWIANNKLNVIVQVGLEKLPDLPNVPAALDLVTDPEKKEVLNLILIRQEMGRPIVTSPGVPAERVAALRAAFDATMQDQDFLAEAAKMQLEVDPLSGAAIDKLLATAYAAPPAIVAQAAALAEPSAGGGP
jgi:tripartite-type tricarboxylate transporter receptor subunit TctC